MDKMMLDSIELLAANPELQRSYLRKLGTYPSIDEIALGFDDAYRGFVARTDTAVSNSVITKINLIDSILDRLSDSVDETVWNEGSLNTAPWNEIRNIATEILREINKKDTCAPASSI